MTFRFKIHKSTKKIILTLVFVLVVVGLKELTNTLTKQEINQMYKAKDVGKRIALIIPGLNETEDKYRAIEIYYSDADITPIFIHIDWKITHLTDFIEIGSKEIEKVAALYPDKDFYFFGFSFGAVVALSNIGKFKSKGTILCSLSPIFQNDLVNSPYWVKTMMKLMRFSPPSYPSIPKETTVFLYGDHDNSKIRSDEIVGMRKRIYSKSEFKIIKDAKHDISGEAYLEQIKREIYKLKADDKNG